ncbi:hypothetical protein D5072_12900 [Dickeya dianthicola]|uniref:Uncharacterized protein n=1 Tax=Dickeya dianthicola TaxID=204039 RepID=A0AAX1C8R4_9GAMM|nr:hypothetical protein DF213_07015 [Dickeya dianthicola]RJL67592.1 hypothetical protein D5072_12900 [Dickeya dianthicola]RJL71865.1 hypothetical protein D5077_12055 [Dickeya dianthicola]
MRGYAPILAEAMQAVRRCMVINCDNAAFIPVVPAGLVCVGDANNIKGYLIIPEAGPKQR